MITPWIMLGFIIHLGWWNGNICRATSAAGHLWAGLWGDGTVCGELQRRSGLFNQWNMGFERTGSYWPCFFSKFGTLGPEENSENRLNIHWSIIRLAIKHDSNGCLKSIFSHTHLADWDCFFLPFGNNLEKHKMRLRFSIAGVEYWRVSSSFLGLTQYIMVVGVLGGESHICFFGNWDVRRFWEEWGIT